MPDPWAGRDEWRDGVLSRVAGRGLVTPERAYADVDLQAGGAAVHARTAAPLASSSGGASWSRGVVSVPSGAKKRNGGPGRVMLPSVGWSTCAIWS